MVEPQQKEQAQCSLTPVLKTPRACHAQMPDGTTTPSVLPGAPGCSRVPTDLRLALARPCPLCGWLCLLWGRRHDDTTKELEPRRPYTTLKKLLEATLDTQK